MPEEENKRLSYLDAMGVQVWQARSTREVEVVEAAAGARAHAATLAPGASASVAPTVTEAGADVDVSQLDWEALRARVQVCTQCELHQGRTQAVFGVGNRNATWMVIGEGPGVDEDRLGEPFVGRAGQLLNNMLLAIGLPREQVYIANIVKCRPPQNRDPRPEEAASCAAYLARQIALVQPQIIVAVGRVAAQNLLNTELSVGRLRGQRFSYDQSEIPVIVTYHPAYLLRSPKEKRRAWQDLLLARETLRGLGTGDS